MLHYKLSIVGKKFKSPTLVTTNARLAKCPYVLCYLILIVVKYGHYLPGQSMVMSAILGYKISINVIMSVTASDAKTCALECLRQITCHSIEWKTDVTIDNCILYGGEGLDLFVESPAPNAYFYSVYSFSSVPQLMCDSSLSIQ